MNESRCKFDRDSGEYMTPDWEICDVPKRNHCTARKTCPQHLEWGQLTCGRCLGRTRADIKHIADYAALLDTAALESRRIDSAAAQLAGPATDQRGWMEYRLAAIGHLDHWLRTGRIKERQYDHARETIDDEEHHPYNVLTRWHLMLAEDYGLELPAKMTLVGSAMFLIEILTRVAHDEEQDFPLLAREIRKCRSHMDVTLSVGPFTQQGVPCPTCVATGKVNPKHVPLGREYSHWCDDPECCREHVTDDSRDRWVCPRDSTHAWSHEDYTNRLEERKASA